ncbi:hypothetical protein GCM10009765_01850 [Fodinicola feengrottensis]|uniref:Uncharacterized protein n=1 Tax=Fodinicola feengrottensis TaxID=435914 RepID=A0ABN2FQ03_9ACTN
MVVLSMVTNESREGKGIAQSPRKRGGYEKGEFSAGKGAKWALKPTRLAGDTGIIHVPPPSERRRPIH